MKYLFIEQHQSEFPVSLMCKVHQVSRSGYYSWRNNPGSERAQKKIELVRTIEKVHLGSRGSYGSPRIFAFMKAMGHRVSKSTIERLMREYGITGRKRRKYRPQTTDSNHSQPIAPNLLDRQFDAGAPGKVWLADITYIRTQKG